MDFKNYLPYYKRNLKVAIPVMLSQAGQVLVQQADNMMVGSVGTVELAAASFANNIFIIGMVIGMGFTFGLTPLTGHAFGGNDNKTASSLLKNATLLNTLIAFVLMVAMYAISFFMDNMGQSEEVAKLAIPYYRILVITMVPFMLFFTLKQFAEGIGNTINAMIITLTANVVNIIVNYLLIFGSFGFPELGLNGAGIGTLIARLFMPLAFLFIFFKKDVFRKYIVEGAKEKLDKILIKRIFEVGWPISTQIVLEVCAFAFGAIMVGWLGAASLAAHQIAIGLASVTFMIVTGISSGTTIRVSHQYSQKNYDGLHKASTASLHLVFAFMSTTAILFMVFRHQLPYLYTSDMEVIGIASTLLVYAALFQIFDGLQVVTLGILRGLTDVKFAMRIAFLCYIIISLPISYLFAFVFEMGAPGVWVGLTASLILASLIFLWRFNVLYKRMSP